MNSIPRFFMSRDRRMLNKFVDVVENVKDTDSPENQIIAIHNQMLPEYDLSTNDIMDMLSEIR